MNKYLHTVASVGFLFTLNEDARNHEREREREKKKQKKERESYLAYVDHNAW